MTSLGFMFPSTTTICALTFVVTLVTKPVPFSAEWTAPEHLSLNMSTAYTCIMMMAILACLLLV